MIFISSKKTLAVSLAVSEIWCKA